MREGWDAVDQTCLRIARIKSARNFHQMTTVSLTGGTSFEQVPAAGELQDGTMGEETYTNKIDTYGELLSITRQDIINDDLNALSAVPRKIGRAAMLKLNSIFWTLFLDNSAIFTGGNNNVSTADGTLGLTGLQQAEAIFINQTDPDGEPLGIMPAVLLVPPSLKGMALGLINSQTVVAATDSAIPAGNVWQGRFRVESSPYMENASYPGFSAVAWYLLADPNQLRLVEIAALNGRVEPTVETADADFNVLGIQMRGYSDVGVALQEYRGGVRADGSGA